MASSVSVSSLNVVGYTHTTSPSPPNHLSSLAHLILITVTVLAVAVTVSLALYFLLRYRRRQARHSPSSSTVFSSNRRVSPEIASSSVTDSLPAFTFSSLTRRSSSAPAGDCAVCLSKFENHDLLRLLPLCCHAFHAECIDTWLQSNLTCPLCRSGVAASESELAKVFRSPSFAGGNSFRLEIGNISSSHRRGGADSDAAAGEMRGVSYAVGSFEYYIDEEAEVAFSHAHRISVTGEKDDGALVEIPANSEPSLVDEIERGGSRNSWLKDYVDRLSATMSFGSSGRFFTGSSRRNDVEVGDFEGEANRFGEEIGEIFSWLSGV
ncbi:hypothetical protein RJT34_15022 [Clitoria ternatea]|uniref:RING-type E3 ubiquitin transferase n=1 Tax=Clitoria ternatea TaxID=43366 RepID=A0AAN9JUV4_CLITE